MTTRSKAGTRSRYLSLNPHRINDRRLRGKSLEAAWLWGQLLTCDLVVLPGLVKGGPGAIAELTGRSITMIRDALTELCEARMVEIDESACLIRIPGIVADHSRPLSSGNTLAGFFAVMRNLPPSRLVLLHAQEIASLFRREGDNAVLGNRAREFVSALTLTYAGDGFEGFDLPTEEPLAGASRSSDQDPDPDLDPDRDPDRNSPLPPQGGEDESRPDRSIDQTNAADSSPVEQAIVAALEDGRRRLGLEGPSPPLDRGLRRSLERFGRARGPHALNEVPLVVRRFAAMLQREGNRSHFNLRDALKVFDRLRACSDYDDDSGGSPASSRHQLSTTPSSLLLAMTAGVV